MSGNLKTYLISYRVISPDGASPLPLYWKCQAESDLHALEQFLNAFEGQDDEITGPIITAEHDDGTA